VSNRGVLSGADWCDSVRRGEARRWARLSCRLSALLIPGGVYLAERIGAMAFGEARCLVRLSCRLSALFIPWRGILSGLMGELVNRSLGDGRARCYKSSGWQLLAKQWPALTMKVKARDAGILLADNCSGVVTAYCHQAKVSRECFNTVKGL
jgi:hypothetical protein